LFRFDCEKEMHSNSSHWQGQQSVLHSCSTAYVIQYLLDIDTGPVPDTPPNFTEQPGWGVHTYLSACALGCVSVFNNLISRLRLRASSSTNGSTIRHGGIDQAGGVSKFDPPVPATLQKPTMMPNCGRSRLTLFIAEHHEF